MPTDSPNSSAPTAHAQFFDEARRCLERQTLIKLVLAGPRGPKPDLQRVLVRPLTLKGRACLSLTYNHRTRDVTKNLPVEEALTTVAALIQDRFDNVHLLSDDGGELQLAISRKGKATLRRSRKGASVGAPNSAEAEAVDAVATSEATQDRSTAELGAHDRAKHRPVDIGEPWLTALGVTDAQHRLIPAMARKWKQINKFIEVLSSALASAPALTAPDAVTPLQVLDFGAGKGYLTFAVHDHLRRALGRPVQVTGVDLKEDMVLLGNQTARGLGLRQPDHGLRFELGDVSSYAPRPVDIMIALHACDTATDHALHMGVRAGAAIIMCSPCCHKQLRPQMRSPLLLLPLLRHGIHLGQEAEMLTDGLRALLLEAEGYDTQVFEFTSLEHTSKNKMILAVKRAQARPAEPVREQIREIKAFYGIDEQRLQTLLEADHSGPA
ncbi:MAG: SAM-dependent methyltransferase [Methylibium sp.]|uniref:class I SAM-dependent methyltransferase n=1 Tax=Methylibium sp. TaxID=2067992 RepID=UPI001822BC0B|nr:SAM-dependent methyltransferase [Methylibium sp.]MBA3598646.1 SAM-dependent methyltransferase [Methylibium sp.]